jgi:hypothetical protein
MLKREREQNEKENAWWLGTLQMLSFYGLDLRSPLDFSKRLAGITVESLRGEAGGAGGSNGSGGAD